MFMR